MDLQQNPWRADFPILATKARGKPLVFLDSAASAQKPNVVLEAVRQCYQHNYANIHRGVYQLSENVSSAYDMARQTVADFIRADFNEIVFTKNTTESINAIASSFAKLHLQAGDEVLVSMMEHHANIVPWQQVCAQYGAILKTIPLLDNLQLDLNALNQLITPKTKLIAITHASNTLGVINPVKDICALAKQHGIATLIDGAQAAPHFAVDVKQIGCDFYVFSAHKLYGPSGVGVLYVKNPWLQDLPPYQTGGGMIDTVTMSHTTFAEPPSKWEAGTPNIEGAIAFAAALQYVKQVGMENIWQHEQALLQYALTQLQTIPAVKVLYQGAPQVGVIGFTVDNAHAYDVGMLLDAEGVAVRTGHHCTMPLHQHLNLASSIRASFGLYNDAHDVDQFIKALTKAIEVLT